MPHTILFSGHMIDQPDRATPRFPSSKEKAAGKAIRQELLKVLAINGSERCKGIAAAACGGDILFHESCQELAIPSEIYIGLPVDEFNKTSVSFAGEDWEARYRRLTQILPVHALFPEATADAGDSIWEKANNWMLQTALADGVAHSTFIALWDGNKGESGGTWQMIRMAEGHQVRTEIIDLSAI